VSATEWIAGLLTGLAALAALTTVAANRLKWIWMVFKRVEQFLEDFYGTKERPGVPGRKGVLERLATIEAEVSYNSGSTIKDAVRRIDVNVKQIAETQAKSGEKSSVH
jgi:hypothetical protein